MDDATANDLICIALNASAASAQAGAIRQEAGRLLSMEAVNMSAVQVLTDRANEIRATTAGLAERVEALRNRLTDNATPEEINAVAADLGEISSQLGGIVTSVDAIDPNITAPPADGGGTIVNDGSGGVVEGEPV